ncbi:MAG TPA: hypothetical protein VI685_23360 [Candidatus Angelobacter sp.]
MASGLLLYVPLALILWRRRVYVRFPIFFAYCLYAVLATAARLMAALYGGYFYVFWCTELFFLFLGVAALHESFRSVFEGFYLLRWFRWVYFGGIAVILLLSILNSIFNRPTQVHPLLSVVLDITTPINCIQAAIFGLFYVSVKLLSVSFRRYAFAIVLGFGILAVGTLIPNAVRSAFGKNFDTFFVYAPSVAYYITLTIWLSAFLRPEADEDQWPPPLSPQQMAEEVTQYTRILKGFFGKSNES